MAWAIGLRGVSPTAKLLAIHIADNYDPAGDNSEPTAMGIARMAEWCGIEPHSVFDHLLEVPAIRLRADLSNRDNVLVWLPLPERRAGL